MSIALTKALHDELWRAEGDSKNAEAHMIINNQALQNIANLPNQDAEDIQVMKAKVMNEFANSPEAAEVAAAKAKFEAAKNAVIAFLQQANATRGIYRVMPHTSGSIYYEYWYELQGDQLQYGEASKRFDGTPL